VKNFFTNIGLSIATFLILFVFLEILFRILGFTTYQFHKNDSDFIQPDSLLNYKYVSNLDAEITTDNYSIHVQTNTYGYRDDEWVLPSDHKKILIVGNSFSVGFGLPVEQRWSNLLEKRLQNEDITSSYSVFNAAVSGYSLEQALNTASYLAPKIEPDIIVVGVFLYGLNRLENPFVYYKGYSVRKDKVERAMIFDDELIILHFKNHSLKMAEAFFYHYSAFYNFVVQRLHNLKDRLSKPAPKDNTQLTEKAISILGDFNEQIQSEGRNLIILPIIIHDNNKEYSLASINSYNSIKTFSRENNIPFVDIYPSLKEKVTKGENFWIENDPHWDEEANRIASDLVFQEILE
jgi:hypothetical protein